MYTLATWCVPEVYSSISLTATKFQNRAALASRQPCSQPRGKMLVLHTPSTACMMCHTRHPSVLSKLRHAPVPSLAHKLPEQCPKTKTLREASTESIREAPAEDKPELYQMSFQAACTSLARHLQ